MVNNAAIMMKSKNVKIMEKMIFPNFDCCSSDAIEFETAKLDKGYKIRFESAVETQKYHTKDAEIALSSAALDNREGVKGNGYIRNVRFIKVQ